MTTGLVIQGPVISGGIRGKSWGKGHSKMTAGDLINFNCSHTIMKNLSEAVQLFDHVAVITWENENTSEINFKELKNVTLLKVPDPGSAGMYRKRQKFAGFNTFHHDNVFRQFESTYAGIKELRKNKVNYCVKIRTDQEINVRRLYDEFVKSMEFADDRLFIPYFLTNAPWAIPDFYLGGLCADLELLCGLMISKKRFNLNVHRDLFVKSVMIYNPKEVMENYLQMFLSSDNLSVKQQEIFDKALRSFTSGSSKLFESIVWRGDKIENSILYLTQQESISFGDMCQKQYGVTKPIESSNIDYLMFFNSILSGGKLAYLIKGLEFSRYLWRKAKEFLISGIQTSFKKMFFWRG